MSEPSAKVKGGHWERRWQPLLSQWVLIASSSAARPWSGQMATITIQNPPVHDPDCYLCPRVTRAAGKTNPDYHGPFAFDNDFPTLSFDAPTPAESTADHSTTATSVAAGSATTNEEHALFAQAPVHGHCRVLCWSERHDATLASLPEEQMLAAARLWRSEYQTLSANPAISNVLIFENKGVEIGVSNLHPHGQIYATTFLTDTAIRMRDSQARYAKEHSGASLLQDMLHSSPVQDHLVVERGTYWSVIVPFAARFAFETWIIPNRHLSSLAEVCDQELSELAQLYQRQVRRYDVHFQRSAPNITLLHNAPCDDSAHNAHWCFHLAFHPPLRDPVKMKFLAGFESGANNIVNPTQPEHAAEQLRQVDLTEWAS